MTVELMIIPEIEIFCNDELIKEQIVLFHIPKNNLFAKRKLSPVYLVAIVYQKFRRAWMWSDIYEVYHYNKGYKIKW